MAALGKIGKIKAGHQSRQTVRPKAVAVRRVSPLKPGLTDARNWATAQLRAAKYSPQKKRRMIINGIFLAIAIVWSGLWIGGFIPNIQAAKNRMVKQRLMGMGFVVERVDVVGEGRISEQEIRAVLGVRPGDYLFDMDLKNAQQRVQSLSWVDNAVVRRLWPNRIVVHVNERQPYALWQSNETLHLIDQTGFAIDNVLASDYQGLPLVVGKDANLVAGIFFQMLNEHKYLKDEVSVVVYVGHRRWDVILKSGVRILLPEENPSKALKRLEQYDLEHKILQLDLTQIDMRVSGRLYLRPKTGSKTGKAKRA
ncbi:MAG: FtsQ-type POTRA domain-containing protein [Robiginitomaculum sp.]